MKSFIVFAAALACASAGVVYSNLGGPIYGQAVYGQAVVGHSVVAAPAVTSSQYHAQDELGQYSYGYAGGPSAKSEVKTADGITRGAYSYVDANGLVQQVNYVADPINGFRVAATNLPVAPAAPLAVGPVHVAQLPVQVQETPEVAAARAAHFQAKAEAEARAAVIVA